MWRIHPSLTLACLSVTGGALVCDTLLLGAFASGLPAEPGVCTTGWLLLFSESVRGMQTIKGFAAEPHQNPAVRAGQPGSFDATKRDLSQLVRCSRRATQFLSQLSLVILFAYGGWLYVQGRIPLGAVWWSSLACSNNSMGKWPTSRLSPIPSSRVLRLSKLFKNVPCLTHERMSPSLLVVRGPLSPAWGCGTEGGRSEAEADRVPHPQPGPLARQPSLGLDPAPKPPSGSHAIPPPRMTRCRRFLRFRFHRLRRIYFLGPRFPLRLGGSLRHLSCLAR